MSKELYQKLLAEFPDDRDYLALDQGPASTKRRHQLVADRMNTLGKRVLDLGCGTGVMLDNLSAAGQLPKSYLGVDFIDRSEDVLARADKLGVDGEFVVGDIGAALHGEALKRNHFDVVAAIGVVGTNPFSTLSALAALVKAMKWIVPITGGIVTLPMARPEFLGCPHQAHFSPTDVHIVFRSPATRVGPYFLEAHTDREMVIWW